MFRYWLYFFAIVRARMSRRRIPLFVTLCVTNRCNLRCIYCYEEYYDRNHREMSTAEILSLIDQLAARGTRYISINGGEALLRGDLEQIVAKIRSKNMLCHLSTNGLLVPERIPLLKKIDSIAVSLDGEQAANDRNRGAGSYARILAGIQAMARAGIKFHVHTVLTRNNQDAVDEMLALARQYGFRVQFSLLRVEDSPRKGIGLDDQELEALIRKILAYKRAGEPVFFSESAYENFLRWPVSYQKQVLWGQVPAGYRPIPCYLKKFSCHIEANGYVYPCVVLVNKLPAKNFLQDGFAAAWAQLADNDCQACNNICCIDMNLIFGLRAGSLGNAVGIILNKLRLRGRARPEV